MSKPSVIVDSSSIDKTLASLDSFETKQMLYNSLRAGAKVLQSNAQGIMLTKPWNFNEKQRRGGVEVKGDPAYCEVKVRVKTALGLHWLELGTVEHRQLKKDQTVKATERQKRLLRKGENRGGIKGTHFFAEARRDETSVTQAIQEKWASEFEKKIKLYQ